MSTNLEFFHANVVDQTVNYRPECTMVDRGQPFEQVYYGIRTQAFPSIAILKRSPIHEVAIGVAISRPEHPFGHWSFCHNGTNKLFPIWRTVKLMEELFPEVAKDGGRTLHQAEKPMAQVWTAAGKATTDEELIDILHLREDYGQTLKFDQLRDTWRHAYPSDERLVSLCRELNANGACPDLGTIHEAIATGRYSQMAELMDTLRMDEQTRIVDRQRLRMQEAANLTATRESHQASLQRQVGWFRWPPFSRAR